MDCLVIFESYWRLQPLPTLKSNQCLVNRMQLKIKEYLGLHRIMNIFFKKSVIINRILIFLFFFCVCVCVYMEVKHIFASMMS